jgi:DNA-binding MurR/RpiR family transcriptional regulator
MLRESAVRKLLEAQYPSLTAQQRKAADYLLSNHRTAFSMSVQELARAADVSEATLVRFARRLGYDGYLELRAALVDEAKRDLLPEDRFAFEEPSVEPTGTLAKVARQEVENINRTFERIDPKQLRRFVDHLRKAELVATVGLGVSVILARLAAYQLFQVGVRAEVLLREQVTLVEQVDHLPKRAVLLAFALPPYSKATAHAIVRAKERRLPVLLVTDGPHSPVAADATAALYAQTENILYTNSISGVTVLLNALATELALANKSRALSQLRASSKALKDEYL